MGWTDSDLTETGKMQACEAGKMLRDEGFCFDIVFSSVLRRDIRTAWQAVQECDSFAMPVINTWRLNDQHLGKLEGATHAEAIAGFESARVKSKASSLYDVAAPEVDFRDPRHPINSRLYKQVPKMALPTSESLRGTVNRVLPFFHDSISPCTMAGKSVLVCASGAALASICGQLEGMSNKEVLKNSSMKPGTLLVYEVDPSMNVLNKHVLRE